LPSHLDNLSTEAKAEYDNKTISNDNKTKLNELKGWIKTNRSMLEYYYDLFSSDTNDKRSSSAKHPKIFYGKRLIKDKDDDGFYKMMYNGTFHNNNIDIAGKWNNNTRSNIMQEDSHNDHWHITAPIGKPAKNESDLCSKNTE
jgi:hypothetical protein